ncbi:HEPN domain-containing protein [Janthinobacterium sp. BJB401]|uniref:HEPN domain-containing protein n=1 Tax=Janthinobacterium sp. BJB401 TaxID=2745934 RepID=UPI001595D9BF|nr:HEPN domain-containing protein [Janthinobacterium sp. BJB401]NVI81334.1 hypothetical protein [Janthinobacterium sp. BJB401]
MKIIQFDHGKWHYELIEALGCYGTLYAYCSNDDAIRSHLMSAGRPKRSSEDGDLEGVADADAESFLEPVAESISIALRAYSRQLVVVIVSLIEGAIGEAFDVLFTFRPETIKSLEGDSSDRSFKAVVSVTELISSSSLDELRRSIVERAISTAMQGSSATVLKRLERLLKAEISLDQKKAFLELVALRNRIVHDNLALQLDHGEVRRYFDVGTDLVEQLGSMIHQNSLPLNDPMYLFGQWAPDQDTYVVTEFTAL